MASLVSTGKNVWQQGKLKKAARARDPLEETQNTQLLIISENRADIHSQLDNSIKDVDLVSGIQKRLQQIKYISDPRNTAEIKAETELEADEEPHPPEEKELTVSEKLDQVHLSLRCKRKAKALLKDEENRLLLKRMAKWLSSNEERALKCFKNIQKENCLTYKTFVAAMIDLDSPFRILESYVIVVKLSTQKVDLISIDDIMGCLPPKKRLVCDICGFGKNGAVETPKAPLKGFQKLFKFPEKKEPTTTFSPWNKAASEKQTTNPGTNNKTHFKAAFTKLKKKPSQDDKHKDPTSWGNRTPKLGLIKKSHSRESKSTFSVFSEQSKETKLDKEGRGTPGTNWQFARKRTQHVMKARMSMIGKNAEQITSQLDQKMPSVDEENQTGMMRLAKRTTAKPLLKRVSSIKTRDFRSEKPDVGKKIFGKLMDGEKATHVKSMFAQEAAGVETNTNDATPLPNTSTLQTKKEERKTPAKSDVAAFSKVRKMGKDEKENSNKTLQPYLIERYILVQLRYLVYDEILLSCAHFSILLANNTKVSYIVHCIKENIDLSCKEVYISPNRLRLRQTQLSPEHTLKQCSYRGYCKSHPQKITLYYDLDLPTNTPFITSLNP